MPTVSRVALLLVVVGSFVQPAAASLRGHRHHKHGAVLSNAQEKVDTTPLYDDFLAIMNHAAASALKGQKDVPAFDDFLRDLNNGAEKAKKDKAYDDFLRVMNTGAEKAYKEQTKSRSYDEFLGLMKQKAEEAYHQQVELPSYVDFLSALKESSVEALRTPTPRYDEFLATLKSGAEKAMQKRVFHELSEDTIKKLEAAHQKKQNPLEKIGNMLPGGKKEKKKKKDDRGKLQEELRRLQAEKKRHGHKGHARKPIMKRINVLRTQLCWKRPNLWQHEKCMRFLGLHCMQESTGEGICKKFTKKAQQKCETSKDSKFKEDYCALAEALSDDDDDDDHDEDEDADAEGEDEDADGHEDDDDDDDDDESEEVKGEVGSEEDLDHELEEMDRELEEHEKKHQAEDAEGGEGKDGKDGDSEGAEDGAKDGAKKKAVDSDGDGVNDDEDAFADDPNEWGDMDEDGTGDNADKDRDGDGHDNEVDVFPADSKEWLDSDHDSIGDNADSDRDSDGIPNDKDKFPLDPTEWKDSDGDGVGDNKDAHPYNPNCHSPTEPCHDLEGAKPPKPGSAGDPKTLDMDAQRDLPSQGFSESMTGAPVHHDNYYTWVSDWQDEWPVMAESEKQTMSKICIEHPTNIWCRRFANHDAHFR